MTKSSEFVVKESLDNLGNGNLSGRACFDFR